MSHRNKRSPLVGQYFIANAHTFGQVLEEPAQNLFLVETFNTDGTSHGKQSVTTSPMNGWRWFTELQPWEREVSTRLGKRFQLPRPAEFTKGASDVQ